MPAALKKPTLDELYRRLRDLDYTRIDERMAVMLSAILQLEEQGECRESATEAVLMIGYTTEGISNQEQTRWLSWNVDGGVRGFDLARNPGLSNNTEYGAGEFPLPTRPSARSTGQSSSKVLSMTRAQQTTEAYPDLGVLKKELKKTQKVTLLVVSTMLALRWIEENITKYREATTPTAESIYAIDYSRRLELFETACKLFAIPTEVRHVWSRLRYFPWFRATLTSWLYMTTKDHMRKHQKEYRQFQAEIGPEAFKRPLLTHRNAITTGWKRVGKMSRDNTKARESILEEDLAKNVSLSLHNSFCLNRESRVKALPNQAKRLQEQREWMRSYEQLKAWEEIVISSDDEEKLLRQFAVSSTSGSGTSKAKSAK